ncbi:nuclear transport factor 2 family protein [Streptomyces sp. NPDC059104]|uniref:nuclear transport factor 2 family protein n=1 Tax=Streptomyces sp. NPDC059104 TaxID=3346729 RepID=UPI0036CF6481
MNHDSVLHRQSRRTHAAIAQFHRWFQLYERPFGSDLVERQLQLFADRFEITTADGRIVVTRDAYREGVLALDPALRHSHHAEFVTVEEVDAHRLRLCAGVRYQRADPSGAVAGVYVAYEATLVGSADSEPRFSRLCMTPKSASAGLEFTDAYPRNRSLAFVHRWLSLVEDPTQGGDHFDELLAPDGEYDLHLGSASIRSRQEMAAWLHAASLRVATSRHTVEEFRVVGVEGDRYTITMDFGWSGSAADGDPMAGRMHHEWILEDTGERYCRIVSAQTTEVEPLVKTGAAHS